MSSIVSVKQLRVSTHELANWLSHQFLLKKLNTPFGNVLLLLLALFTAYVGSTYGLFGLALIAIVPLAIAFALYAIFNLEKTYYLLFVYILIIPSMRRLVSDSFPFGLGVELLIALALVAFLFDRAKHRDHNWQFLNNPVTYAYLVLAGYMVVQVFNPNLESIYGWIQAMRRIFTFSVIYVVTLYLFREKRFVRKFLNFWIIAGALCGLYGCFQEFFGLRGFEEAWVRADDVRYGLIYVMGRMRKFSLFAGPMEFGIFSAVIGLIAMAMATRRDCSYKVRILYILAAGLMFLGMIYSGTRTAYAVAFAGFVMFMLMTINNRTTLVLSLLVASVFVVMMFGPIYGNPNINRFRSAFKPTTDASFQVRESNRHFIQPYLRDKPIGWGLGTTGRLGTEHNPNHILAGFPPDSGYLEVGLETGWIGMILSMLIFLMILSIGIRTFYRSLDPEIKLFAAVFTVFFYAVAVAEFAQATANLLPIAFIIYAGLGIVANLRSFSKQI